MSLARRRRKWLRWDRYTDYLCRFGDHIVSPDGARRAHNDKARWWRRKNSRNKIDFEELS